MAEDVEYRVTMICDHYVQLPDGKRISHYEYNLANGTNYQPGPLAVKMDWRKPQGFLLFD